VRRSRRKPLIGKLEIQNGGKGVIAEKIEHLHLHSDSGSKAIALSPFATVPPLAPLVFESSGSFRACRSRVAFKFKTDGANSFGGNGRRRKDHTRPGNLL
jgi:hypothetical protein